MTTSAQSEFFDLDREQSINACVDAFGRRWRVAHVRGSNLYAVKSDELRKGSEIPELIDGKWTKVNLLENRIREYVKSTWDKAEEKAKKAPGKARAKKAAEEVKESAASSSD